MGEKTRGEGKPNPKTKTKIRVTFQPEGEVVEAEPGKTLLQIAKEAGIPITSICGGDGICGRCRVIVKKGKVEASPTTLLTREEVQQGYVLACQTKVLGDVEVEIPPESRGEGAQILIDVDAQRFRALYAEADERAYFRHDPLVKKLYLELPPPTLQDNLGDQERLYREIRRRIPAPIMQTGLKVLRGLPRLLREHDWKVTATLARRGGTTEVLQLEGGDRSGANLGVAVDVGTSTVVAHLVDLTTSRTLDAEACYNSQRTYGEEVTRRIIYAEREPGGLAKLQEAIVGDINRLIALLVARNRLRLRDITAVICAGNTTMTHLLLGLDPAQIRRDPYIPAATNPPPVRAAEVGIKINPRGLLYVMPCIGSWVGGDITAGVLATGLYASEKVCMLIDIGTNGEVVLGNREWMIACSTSAGPAFEGSGVRCGMRASRGAIERVEISPNYVRYKTIWDAPPQGLCGSGLIDAIAGLFEAGYLDRSGRLQLDRDRSRVREQDGQLEFVLVPAAKSGTGQEIVITQRDIENVLRAKAAIYAGAKILVQQMGLDFDQVERIYLAGGFGNYLDREKAIILGLIPDVPLERIRFVGNTAIIGAKMALLSEEAYDRAYEIARAITYYDLISYPRYYEEFMSAKFLPHTELGRFPSVVRKLALKEEKKERV